VDKFIFITRSTNYMQCTERVIKIYDIRIPGISSCDRLLEGIHPIRSGSVTCMQALEFRGKVRISVKLPDINNGYVLDCRL